MIEVRENVRKGILVLSVAVFLVSGGMLAKFLYERASARAELGALQEIARADSADPESRSEPEPAPVAVVSVETSAPVDVGDFIPLTPAGLARLVSINPDFAGWLTIPGTRIDYPVVKSSDDVKYLTRSFEGKSRSGGTLFLDKRADGAFGSQNSVIYGHNMQDKTMFHDLMLLRNRTTFNKANKAYLQLPDGTILCYEIFSVYPCVPEYDYRAPEYPGESATGFFQRITERSSYADGIVLTPEDRILTFSTCVYDFNDARLAVHGKLVNVVRTVQ